MLDLVLSNNSQRFLNKCPSPLYEIITKVLEELRADPKSSGTLKGNSLLHKKRIGKYRIIYRFDTTSLVIVRIGHRKNVYNRL